MLKITDEHIIKLSKAIPQKSIRELVVLWHNCLKEKDNPINSIQAEKVNLLVKKEFAKRNQKHILSEGYFKWPNTDVNSNKSKAKILEYYGQQEGYLKFFGYTVGKTNGLDIKLRQKILGEIFNMELPKIFSDEYYDQWAEGESSRRLRKIAETIAHLARNAKKKGSDMDVAVKHWEEDLDFLYWTFYVEKFHFDWPKIK